MFFSLKFQMLITHFAGTGNSVTGIFIKSVCTNSPAGRSSKIFMGDRILSVNDIDLRNATHEQAVQAIKNAKNPVHFVVQSLQSFTPDKVSHLFMRNCAKERYLVRKIMKKIEKFCPLQ